MSDLARIEAFLEIQSALVALRAVVGADDGAIVEWKLTPLETRQSLPCRPLAVFRLCPTWTHERLQRGNSKLDRVLHELVGGAV